MGLRESAVLIPILYDIDDQPQILFIVRRADAPTHSGQIAFPGGKREAADPTLADTALRESYEEVGLPTEHVHVAGLLDDVPTPARFNITPVVGVVGAVATPAGPGAIPLRANQGEVAELFRVPLAMLASTYHLAGHTRWQGVRYALHEFHYPDPTAQVTRRIWGATARITYQLLEMLELLPPMPADGLS